MGDIVPVFEGLKSPCQCCGKVTRLKEQRQASWREGVRPRNGLVCVECLAKPHVQEVRSDQLRLE